MIILIHNDGTEIEWGYTLNKANLRFAMGKHIIWSIIAIK